MIRVEGRLMHNSMRNQLMNNQFKQSNYAGQ